MNAILTECSTYATKMHFFLLIPTPIKISESNDRICSSISDSDIDVSLSSHLHDELKLVLYSSI